MVARLTARRAVGLAAVLLLAAASGIGCSGAHRGIDSLLLVTLDTVRADHLGCYDARSPSATPAIDALAASGLRVERAWTTVPLTTPAHASILSGLHPQAHGVRNNGPYRLPDRVTTLAEAARAAGRRTAAFVSSYTTSREFGLAQGFDVYDDDLGHDPSGHPRPQRPGAETVRRARSWLEGVGGAPFLLWVHLFDAHSPYTPPAELARRHPDDPYAAEVELVDRLVGELVATLDRLGLRGRTAIVLVADHGEGLGDHGEKEHGFLLYEEALRVPLIVVAPGRVGPGTVLEAPASVVDVVPTALDLLGIEPPPGVQGRDLLASGSAPERWLYAEALQPFEEFGWSPLYAGLDGTRKIIDGPHPELYDLRDDPGERNDRAAKEESDAEAMVASLRALARGWADPELAAEAAGAVPSPASRTRLESLGYAGGAAGGATAGLPPPRGRSPREALFDHERFLRAQELLKAGQFGAARSILERLHREEPQNPQFLLKLAVARDRAGDPRAAEAAYRALAESHPRFQLARSFHADFLVRHGRAGEAIALWREVGRRFPKFVGLAVRRAGAQIAAGRIDEAIAGLERHLQESPEDVDALAALGRARAAAGDRAGAIEAWERAVALRPTHAPALEPLVRALRAAGEADRARRLLERLRRVAPGDPLIRRLLAEDR